MIAKKTPTQAVEKKKKLNLKKKKSTPSVSLKLQKNISSM